MCGVSEVTTGLALDVRPFGASAFTQVAPSTSSPGADRVALPPRGVPTTLPQDPFLTGEESAQSPGRAAIERDVQAAFARMNAYYSNEWYPKNLAATRLDLPKTLTNVSHYRSFDQQAEIVRGVLRNQSITQASSDDAVRRALSLSLTTRSIPGFSRHHWGTEIDVVSADAEAWKPGGKLWPLAVFMTTEAPRFGFYNSFREGAFPEPGRPHYNSEPWHISYFPIATGLRDRWLSEVNVPALLERVAMALSSVANINVLRRVLPTLDLPSFHRNVVPSPLMLAAERVTRPGFVRV